MKQVGNVIHRARKTRKLTYKDMYEKIGVSPQTIRNWESGRNLNTIMKFLDYMDEIGVDPMTLIK